jgi:hypothetical protein
MSLKAMLGMLKDHPVFHVRLESKALLQYCVRAA